MENKGGGKRPDYQLVRSTDDGLKKEGAGWKNVSKQGNPYVSIVMDNGAKYMLMINKSELNIGFKAGLLDSKSAPRFIPISNSYINNTNNVGLQTTGLNLYSIMKLGNAFVKVEWENLLDANYYNVAFYPERGQIVKLSVAWSFFD